MNQYNPFSSLGAAFAFGANPYEHQQFNNAHDEQMRGMLNASLAGGGWAGNLAARADNYDEAVAERKRKHGTYKPVDPFANPNRAGFINLVRNIFVEDTP